MRIPAWGRVVSAVAILSVAAATAYGETFRLHVVSTYDFSLDSLGVYAERDGATYFRGSTTSSRLYRLAGGGVTEIAMKAFRSLRGSVNGSLVVRVDLDRSKFTTKVIAMDPVSGRTSDFDDSWLGEGFAFLDYQNGTFYSSKSDGNEGFSYFAFLNDLGRKTQTALPFRGAPVAISPDKMHLVAHNSRARENGTLVWDVLLGKIEGTFAEPGMEANVGFYGNDIVYVGGRSNGGGFFSLAGRRLLQAQIGLEDDGEVELLHFVRSQNLAIASIKGGRATAILDASPIEGWLDSHGYLFRKTTGLLNAANVSMRENPNLGAKILATLKKGVAVDVVDRSSMTLKVQQSEDWWYKVRLEDGSSGWVYGAYLDLKEKQGPIEFSKARQ